MGEENNPKWELWFIFGSLALIAGLLFNINNTLQDSYDAQQYTSASADYLKNIENILEDIKSK